MSPRTVLRWLMVVVLLLFALFVVLRPRTGGGPQPQGATEPAGQSQTAGESQPDGATQTRSGDLDRLRAQANLQPCPQPQSAANPAAANAGAKPVEGPLSGIVLPCLGAPGTVELGSALAGRPALLNLWGPLCQPCVEELPALAAYAAEPDAIAVLGVEVQQLPEAALDMLIALDVDYPSVSDPDSALRAALGAPPVLPLTYMVYPDGRVVQVNPPRVVRTPEEVRAIVERYLDPGEPG